MPAEVSMVVLFCKYKNPIELDIALSSTSVPLQSRWTKREAIDLLLTIERTKRRDGLRKEGVEIF